MRTLSLICVRQNSLVDAGLQEERIAEAERGLKPMPCPRALRWHRLARAVFTRERKCARSGLVEKRREQVDVDELIFAGLPRCRWRSCRTWRRRTSRSPSCEWLKLYDALTGCCWVERRVDLAQQRGVVDRDARRAGLPSWPSGFWKKLSSARRWQSALPLISASFAARVGCDGAGDVADLRAQVRTLKFPVMPSKRAEEEQSCPS